jgi:hypothetical protein
MPQPVWNKTTISSVAEEQLWETPQPGHAPWPGNGGLTVGESGSFTFQHSVSSFWVTDQRFEGIAMQQFITEQCIFSSPDSNH